MLCLQVASDHYTYFLHLGNSKHPFVRGLGLVNLFMCQFPFDLNLPMEPSDRALLATYDIVLVNSQFTLKYATLWEVDGCIYVLNDALKETWYAGAAGGTEPLSGRLS